jgi:alkaline phosphatase
LSATIFDRPANVTRRSPSGTGNMAVRWVGPEATADGGKQPAAKCTPNPDRVATQPSLSDMTSKAIELLSRRHNDKGFFLQVEGASIDKQDHAANACGQIGETVDLDEAVKVALAFAKRDGDTTVFVTADHAPMTISYATAAKGSSMQHTGTQLRIAGYGPGAANIVGLTDQTDLNTTIRRLLGLK